MIKNEFWKNVADAWSRKEIIEIPSVEDEISMPEKFEGNESDDEIEFDDWYEEDIDDMDDFFGDILGE